MRIFKNLKAATLASVLIAAFMFLLPGAGVSLADGYARHYNPAHAKPAHANSGNKHAQHYKAARHNGSQVTQRVVTTTRYYTPGSVKQGHAWNHYNTHAKRHQHHTKKHVAHSSFKQHQKLRHSNFRQQRRAQQHVRHNLGLFAALPGIIVNVPL